jgi:hypothetical protein
VRCLLILLASAGACSGTTEHDVAADLSPIRQAADGGSCILPPLSACQAPPNQHSNTDYHCPVCSCGGFIPLPVCNLATGDCRYFSGCYPQGYERCSIGIDPDDPLLTRCGECFLGPNNEPTLDVPPQCNKLQK